MATEKVLNHSEIFISSRVHYLEKESRPDESLFVFSYQMKIQNRGLGSVKLLSRHWIISNGYGVVEEVQGAGVVGQQPTLEPDSIFEYESLCPLTTSTGAMKGFYHFVKDDGTRLSIEIPEFFLVAPQALH